MAASPRDPFGCHLCGSLIRTGYNLLGGPICNTCYSRLRRQTKICPGCGWDKVLAFFDHSGAIVCAPCAGFPPRFGCKSCGSEFQLAGSQCGTCRLRDRAQELLSTPAGTVHEDLVGLLDHLTSAPDPRSVIRWFKRDPVGATLRSLAIGAKPISHATMDELPYNPRTRYLRRVLVSAGTLPDIDVHLNDLERWIEVFLQGRTDANRRILRQFANWHVLPRARRKAGSSKLRSTHAYEYHRRLVEADSLLVWLNSRQTGLTDLTQAQLETYLLERPQSAALIRTFIAWGRSTRLVRDLTVPHPGARASPSVDDDKRWQQIDRLHTDASLPLTPRIIGIFVLAFGQHVNRAVELTLEDVRLTEAEVTVRFAADYVLMPPMLAALIREHMKARTSRSIYKRAEQTWVFEGLAPNTHLSAASVLTDFRRAGIAVRQNKRGAWRELSGRMPSAVASDQFGMSVQTAERMSLETGSRWKAYPAARLVSAPLDVGDTGRPD